MTALALGWMMDLIIGDPHKMPHPIRAIGAFIGFLEKQLNDDKKSPRRLRMRGLLLVSVVLILPSAVCMALMIISYRINRVVGVAAEAVITCYMLASRSLYDESMKVYHALEKGDTEGARKAVSMIVGRDTEELDNQGIIRAAVETVAENTSDGVTASLFYLALGGPAAGVIYKSVNTMDSMIGYKNERFKDFGFFAAKLDDILNFIPARLCALFMIAASALAGRDYDVAGAFRIFRRDRYKHASPNSAQCESVCAGALGIRLAGPASYFGKTVHKEYIGDALREAEPEDIVRANRLMLITSGITFAVFELLLWIFA